MPTVKYTDLDISKLTFSAPEENKAINAGIAADPDTRELSEIEMATLKPVRGLPVGSGKNHWQTKINATRRASIKKTRRVA